MKKIFEMKFYWMKLNSKLNTEEGNNESEDRATWNIKKELSILYSI